MPFIFSEDEIEVLAERVAAHLLPHLVAALKSKTRRAVEELGADMMSVDDLAKRLNCSRKVVYTMVRLGEVPHIRAGKYIRFQKYQIEDSFRQGIFNHVLGMGGVQ